MARVEWLGHGAEVGLQTARLRRGETDRPAELILVEVHQAFGEVGQPPTALGRIGGRQAATLCRRMVEERAPLAIEAALALAELPGAADDEVLLSCVRDRHGDATLRTACACALARRGEREAAPRWIMAIVRAGTPAGLRDESELGVPDKTRWARERYFVQRTLLALGHQDLCDQLDTDAPWPALERLAPLVAARLAGQ